MGFAFPLREIEVLSEISTLLFLADFLGIEKEVKNTIIRDMEVEKLKFINGFVC